MGYEIRPSPSFTLHRDTSPAVEDYLRKRLLRRLKEPRVLLRYLFSKDFIKSKIWIGAALLICLFSSSLRRLTGFLHWGVIALLIWLGGSMVSLFLARRRRAIHLACHPPIPWAAEFIGALKFHVSRRFLSSQLKVEISGIFVDPDFRKQGIFHGMLNQVFLYMDQNYPGIPYGLTFFAPIHPSVLKAAKRFSRGQGIPRKGAR